MKYPGTGAVAIVKNMESPRAAIIVINWNRVQDTIECLNSIKKITYPSYRIVVVDNGSEGQDVEVLRTEFGDWITLIASDRNYGFAGGHNRAVRYLLEHSEQDYFLLLNNDTVVEPDFLTQLIEVAEADASIGIAGPKILFHGAPDRIQNTGCRVDRLRGSARAIGYGRLDADKGPGVLTVDYVDACILVKAEVIKKIGLLDESYFCYWEDIDFCTRAREAGYRVACATQARIWHKKSPATQYRLKLVGGGRQLRESPAAEYYISRNMFKYLRRHASRFQYLLFLCYLFVFKLWYTSAVFLLWRQDLKALSAYWQGVRDGLSLKNTGTVVT